MEYHFGVGAPPIVEPILVGIGMFTVRDFDPWPHVTRPLEPPPQLCAKNPSPVGSVPLPMVLRKKPLWEVLSGRNDFFSQEDIGTVSFLPGFSGSLVSPPMCLPTRKPSNTGLTVIFYESVKVPQGTIAIAKLPCPTWNLTLQGAKGKPIFVQGSFLRFPCAKIGRPECMASCYSRKTIRSYPKKSTNPNQGPQLVLMLRHTKVWRPHGIWPWVQIPYPQ